MSTKQFYAKMATMPPLEHKAKGAEFDAGASAVLKWIGDNFTVVELAEQVFWAMRQTLVFDSMTNTWKGRAMEDYERAKAEKAASREARKAAKLAVTKKPGRKRGKSIPDNAVFAILMEREGAKQPAPTIRELEALVLAGHEIHDMKRATFFERLKWARSHPAGTSRVVEKEIERDGQPVKVLVCEQGTAPQTAEQAKPIKPTPAAGFTCPRCRKPDSENGKVVCPACAAALLRLLPKET